MKTREYEEKLGEKKEKLLNRINNWTWQVLIEKIIEWPKIFTLKSWMAKLHPPPSKKKGIIVEWSKHGQFKSSSTIGSMDN